MSQSPLSHRLKTPGHLIATAFADEADTTNNNPCDDGEAVTTGITCILLSTGGVVTPTALRGTQMGDTLRFRFFDTATDAYLNDVDSATSTPQRDFIYLATQSQGAATLAKSPTSGTIAALGQDISGTSTSSRIATMSFDSDAGRFKPTSGTADDGYLLASRSTADKNLYYHAERSDFVSRSESAVYTFAESDMTTNTLDSSSSTVCPPISGSTVRHVKLRGLATWFSYSNSAATSGTRARICNLRATSSGFLTLPALSSTILSIAAFDVSMTNSSSSTWSQWLAVVETSSGYKLLAHEYTIRTNILSLEALSVSASITGVLDLDILSAQPADDSSAGEAVLLSASGLYFIDYDVFDTTCEEDETSCTADGTSLPTLTATPDISSPGTALAMALNEDNSKIYIVNDDDTIQVIDAATRAVESTISLSTYFGVTLDYGATSITYTSEVDGSDTHEYLLIGSSTLGGTMTVEL